MNAEDISILHEAADLLFDEAQLLADSHTNDDDDWDDDFDSYDTHERMMQLAVRLREIAEKEAAQ